MPYSATDDTTLSDWVRSGDEDAFRELWERHWPAARTYADRFSGLADPDDVVQEAFIKVHDALEHGGGPDAAFRSYLYRTVHNVAVSAGRRRRATPAGHGADLELLDVRGEDGDDTSRVLEDSVVARAFLALPERWRTVLWLRVVEDRSAEEVGRIVGLSPNATAALSHRAREGFKIAWLEAHTATAGLAPGCAWCVERLGRLERGALPAGERAAVLDHIDTCDDCRRFRAQMAVLGRDLRGILLPLAGLAAVQSAVTWTGGEAHGAGGTTAGAAPAGAPVPLPGAALTAGATVPAALAAPVGLTVVLTAVLVAASVLLGLAPQGPVPASAATLPVAPAPVASTGPAVVTPAAPPEPVDDPDVEPIDDPDVQGVPDDSRDVDGSGAPEQGVGQSPVEPVSDGSAVDPVHGGGGSGRPATAGTGRADPTPAPGPAPMPAPPAPEVVPDPGPSTAPAGPRTYTVVFPAFAAPSSVARMAVPVDLTWSGGAAEDVVVEVPADPRGYFTLAGILAEDGSAAPGVTVDRSDPAVVRAVLRSGTAVDGVRRLYLDIDHTDPTAWASLTPPGESCTWRRPRASVEVAVVGTDGVELGRATSSISGAVACTADP